MGKINKQKQKVLSILGNEKPTKVSKPTLAPSSRVIEINPWKTMIAPVVLPSQTEMGTFNKPKPLKNGFTDVVTFHQQSDRPSTAVPWDENNVKSISTSVKKKLAVKKKKKRLNKQPHGFKPLITVESKHTTKGDRSVNRFLYFDHAEVTEENEDGLWSIDDLLDANGTDGGEVEINKGMTGGPVVSVKRSCDAVEESEAKRLKPPSQSCYYVKPVESGVNVYLKKDATIFLHGLFELQVLVGTVEIMGAKLDVNSKPVKIYSSRGTAFLTITNLNTANATQLSQINEKLSKQGARKLHPEDAIIFCKPFETKLVQFLEENLPQVLFPKVENNVRCVFRDHLSEDWSVFQKNEQWEGIFERTEKDSRVMLCGGKGVGKSTLLRVIINRLLQLHGAVAVVDLDAGQAEFTIAGCISTLVVKDILLGPNYTHLRKPERCIFIPHIDITSSYETYLLGIKELMSSPKLPTGIPTVVNYMGFTKGLGMKLAAAAITAVQPTLVVQIDSSSAFKNYSQDLIKENVCSNNNLLPADISGDVDYDLLKVDSVANGGNVWELQPRQMREMSILAYFSKVLPPDCSYLTEVGVKLYRTDLNDVKIIHNDKICDPMAANANIVGLCKKVKDSIYECYGWGIVRSVSLDLGHLTLITPLDGEELEQVDHLILGSVSLPPSLYFRNHADVIGHVPYVYEGEMQNFAKSPKRSIVPKKVA